MLDFENTENDPKNIDQITESNILKTQHEWTKRERFRGDLGI